MKKLIALFAVSTVASTSAIAGVALSGSASVSYDDNGVSPSSTSYDADLTAVGTAGTTTVTISMDLDGSSATSDAITLTGVDMATKLGPVSISADMLDEISVEASTVSGGQRTETVDVTLGGTFSGVTVSHTVGDTTKTTASASIAGIDMSVTNKAGSTTWTLDTTVSGIDLTLGSDQKVTAAFGLAGNRMTVTSNPSVAYHAGTVADNDWNTVAADAYSTVAVSRDLTSGASLTATYSTKDDSLTLKAAVAF